MRAETASGQRVNPETYLDAQHGQLDVAPGTVIYPAPGKVAAPEVKLAGTWTVDAEKSTAGAPGAQIVLGMHAQTVNLVLATPSGKPIDAIVTLDGQPVPAAERGASVHVDASGRTVVTVKSPDMYRLVAARNVEDHQLTVVAEQPGLEAYAFTFG